MILESISSSSLARRVLLKELVLGTIHKTTTELVALGLRNPSVSVPRNRERTGPGFLTHVIYTIEVIEAHPDGPYRREMTLLTTNENAELVEFYACSLRRFSTPSTHLLDLVNNFLCHFLLVFFYILVNQK